MANLRLSPWNFIDDGFVEADTEAGGLVAINVQNVSRSKVWRSATGNTTYYLRGHWSGGTRRATSFGVFLHNLLTKPGGAASYRLRLFPNSNWTGTPTYDSGTVSAAAIGGGTLSYDWGLSTGADRYDPLYGDSPIALYFAEASCQSWKLDLSNFIVLSAEYAQIGRVFLGRYLETTYNPKPGALLGEETNSDQIRTRGGSLHTNEGERWPILTLDLDWIPEAQRYVWADIMRKVGLTRDVMVSLFPGANTRAERDYTIDGKFKSLDPLNWTTNAYRSKRIVVVGC